MNEEPALLTDEQELELPSIAEINAIYLVELDQHKTIEVLRSMGMIPEKEQD
jgi:hypothetical protein